MEKKQVFGMLGVIIAITLGIVMYIVFFGNQYTVTFDSNGGTEVDSQTVKVGGRVEEPEPPVRDGFEFIEWQLRGKTFDFSSKISKNITLVARWQRIADISELIYIVSFDSAGGSSINNQDVEAGGKAIRPTNPVRSGYTFEGWFVNDTQYDFNKTITSDLKLTARWKEKASSGNNSGGSLSGELKEGDLVKIVGEYAASSTSEVALHTRARGWKRVIIRVYEGREFPYRVGDSTGTTGYFKAESLEKVN